MENEYARKDARKALLYDIRLLVDASEKGNYTKQELLEFLDAIAAKQNDD